MAIGSPVADGNLACHRRCRSCQNLTAVVGSGCVHGPDCAKSFTFQFKLAPVDPEPSRPWPSARVLAR